MSRSKKKQPTFTTFKEDIGEKILDLKPSQELREEQIEAVKKFSSSVIQNPYHALPATGLSRILNKTLPSDIDGIVQYYNHIDTIHATSFAEKCRILAHANALFHGNETNEAFVKEQGNWTEFLEKIGQTRSQVSRYVSFWNVFGETILQKVMDTDFSASKLAELLNWPEDPKVALIEEKKYSTPHGNLTVFEMTREQLREVKKILNNKQKDIIQQSTIEKKYKLNVNFNDADTVLYEKLKVKAEEQGVKLEQVVKLALEYYVKNLK